MSSKMSLINFDIYARRVGFFYKNRERISSYCGLLLTFIYVVASLVLFIYYMIITTQRKEIRVYDSSLYSKEMPVINISKNYFYFAFGLEDPTTLNRFVDESIYIPEVVYIDRAKINGEFKTLNRLTLPLEKCQESTFGEDYQHLFVDGELANSYCLKDFDYNLTFQGGFKYEKMSYVRIKIFPCKNSTENNNRCKPQKEIDNYLTSGYFSILLKDIGLNPSNYSYPIIPTLQDLYTTVDRRFYKNYILTFGLTEVQTDTGLFDEQINNNKYIQFRKEFETFVFREEEEYYNGEDIILVQIRLDDNILVQKRTYTKISEIFSRIGGYMQLMNTAFLLISLLINRLNAELKILNSIFNFNINENKMTLKYQSLNSLYSPIDSKFVKNFDSNTTFHSKNSNSKDSEINKSNLNLLLNNNNNNKNQENPLNNSKNSNIFEESKNKEYSKVNIYKREENIFQIKKNIFKKVNTEKLSNTKIPKGYIDHLNLNFFDRFFTRKFSNKRKMVHLFGLASIFYRKRMDIVISFSRSLLIEKILLKSGPNKSYSLCNETQLLYNKI